MADLAWSAIEQDYLTDDFQFRHAGPLPPRVDLATGKVRILDTATFQGWGAAVRGGAATVRIWSHEVIIGLMAATFEREADAPGLTCAASVVAAERRS